MNGCGCSKRGRGEARVSPMGGGVREEGVSKRERSFLHQTPLHDTHVLPPCRDQVTVSIQEADICHMTAVGTVLMAGSLWTYTRKLKHEVEKVTHSRILITLC